MKNPKSCLFHLLMIAFFALTSSCDNMTKEPSAKEAQIDTLEEKATPNPKERHQLTKSRSIEQVRHDFLKAMDWYHEEVEFDHNQIKIMQVGNDTYSIKITQTYSAPRVWHWPVGKCQGGCKGTGKDILGESCYWCKGTGRNELVHHEKVKIGTIQYLENTNQFSLDIDVRTTGW